MTKSQNIKNTPSREALFSAQQKRAAVSPLLFYSSGGFDFGLVDVQQFAEPLEVHYLTCPEEADNIVHVRVIGETEDVVICGTGFLLGCNYIRTTFLFKSSSEFQSERPLFRGYACPQICSL